MVISMTTRPQLQWDNLQPQLRQVQNNINVDSNHTDDVKLILVSICKQLVLSVEKSSNRPKRVIGPSY